MDYSDINYIVKLPHVPDTLVEEVAVDSLHNRYSIKIFFTTCFGKMNFEYYKNNEISLKGIYEDAPNMRIDTISTVDTLGIETRKIINMYPALKEGKWIYYGERGQIVKELNFSSGNLDGEQYFYNNGTKVLECNFSNGILQTNCEQCKNINILPY